MNDQVPTVSDITAVTDIAPAPAQELATEIANTDTNQGLGDLNLEVKEGEKNALLAVIVMLFPNLENFFTSLFGKESKDEESENKSKWEELIDSPLFIFFEETKDTFSLTQENTNPDDFNEKYEDPNFQKIMEFLKALGGTYSQESLAILWSNKGSLKIEGKKLMIEKESGELQNIEITNDEDLATSIIPKESVSDRVPAFVKNLKASFTKNFSDIPQEYKSKIPTVMEHFEDKLQAAVLEGRTPKLKIMPSIEATISIPSYAKSTINNKLVTFFASADGKKLKGQYKDLWKA